ncbi:MAG: hypothetical protein V2A78_09110 [bacterium]
MRPSLELLQKSLRLQEQDLLAEAEEPLAEALRKDPANPVLLLFMGILKWDQGDCPAARPLFEKSLSLEEGNTTARCFYNLALYAQEKNEAVFSFLKKEQQNATAAFQGRLLLFCESRLLNNCASFEDYLERFLPPSSFFDAPPPPSPLRRRLILARYAFLGRISLIRHPLSAGNRSALRHYQAALRERALADIPGAVAELNKALESGKSKEASQELLSEMLLEGGEVFRAHEAFSRSQSFAEVQSQIEGHKPPSNSYALLLAALLDFYTARYAEAETILRLAVQVDPTNYIPCFFQGLLSLRAGGDAMIKACRFFQQTAESPNENLVKRRLEKLEQN